MNQSTEEFDYQVRKAVYEVTLQRGYPPTLVEASSQLQADLQKVGAAF